MAKDRAAQMESDCRQEEGKAKAEIKVLESAEAIIKGFIESRGAIGQAEMKKLGQAHAIIHRDVAEGRASENDAPKLKVLDEALEKVLAKNGKPDFSGLSKVTVDTLDKYAHSLERTNNVVTGACLSTATEARGR